LIICTHTQAERYQNHGEKGMSNSLVFTHCEDEFVYGVIVGELHKAEAFLLSCKETRSSPMKAFKMQHEENNKSTKVGRRKPKTKSELQGEKKRLRKENRAKDELLGL